jgi:hypothetical protein
MSKSNPHTRVSNVIRHNLARPEGRVVGGPRGPTTIGDGGGGALAVGVEGRAREAECEGGVLEVEIRGCHGGRLRGAPGSSLRHGGGWW